MNRKTMFLFVFVAALLVSSTVYSGNSGENAEKIIYTSPDGKPGGAGAIDSPVDIYTAVARIEPGGTIYMRGGVYYLTKGVDLDKTGTKEAPYKLWAYKTEKPVFDCSKETVPNANNVGVRITEGQWWYIKGLEVRNAYHSGFKIWNGSHNTFERCVAHHNGNDGFHIGYEHGDRVNVDGEKAAYNTFLNCDAYNNFDWYTTRDGRPVAGTNADGFACKISAGKGNRYIGCRSWSNSDDGWDFFESGYGAQLINCWTWNSGVMNDHVEMYMEKTGRQLTAEEWDGDGNGFKMGGGCLNIKGRTCKQESLGTHVLRGCISFNNKGNGFDQNNHGYGAIIENCISFGNGYNMQFYDPNKNGTAFTFRNCISFGGSNADRFERISIAADEGNLWNQSGLTANPAGEFVSLDPVSAKAARGADGSLPAGFARLKSNSVFINKGVPTKAVNDSRDDIFLPAIKYLGIAPDLGAFEFLVSAQPWPREPHFTVDNMKRITDASVSIFNLHSDYDFPYVIPTREDVTEKLTRIANFLEGATTSEIVSPANGAVIDISGDIPLNFAFGKGDFRPYSYEWGVTYNGMLKATSVTGDTLFYNYVAKRMRLLALVLPAVNKYLAADRNYKSPLNKMANPPHWDDAGALCAVAIRTQQAGMDFDLRTFIDYALDFISSKQYRLTDGTLARNTPYPNTLWLDDLYMSVPALADAYIQTKQEKYLTDATRQILNYAKRMFVPEINLFMHGYVEAMEPHPTLLWGRANGWAILATADLLDALPENHPQYKKVLDVFRQHCRGLLQCQSGKGMWHQLLDRNDSYPESSCTAMFVYGLAHGINKGWLDDRIFGPAALLGWNALSGQINNMGQIENVCVGTGISFDPAYYYHRRVHPYTAHGYGPVLMAGSEIISLVENFNIEQNTTIFFYGKK